MESLRTRGRTFTGVVVETKMQLTATIEWPRRRYVTKFERYATAKTRIKAHNPTTINAKAGDVVKIMECRPISKTKHFIIIEKVGREKLFEAKQELMEEGKMKQKKADEAKNESS